MQQSTDEQLLAIHERNKRVEMEKAWETSWTRLFSILLITYITASIFLWWIGSSQFYLQALVPSGGYLLSTLSLPWIKKHWMKKNQNGE